MEKLNGVQFQGNCLIIEEPKSRRKSNVTSNTHSRPHVINSSSENENTFPRNKFVPGYVTYADAANSVKRSFTGHRQNRIVIFGNSITCRIQVRDFNKESDTGHAEIRTFPGAILKEFPHYVIPTLEDGNFNIAILHFPVNDLLLNRTRSKAVDDLSLNLKKTATKCMSFGVNLFVDAVNSKIISMRKPNSFGYIHNGNIYIYLTMAFICWNQVCIY